MIPFIHGVDICVVKLPICKDSVRKQLVVYPRFFHTCLFGFVMEEEILKQ